VSRKRSECQPEDTEDTLDESLEVWDGRRTKVQYRGIARTPRRRGRDEEPSAEESQATRTLRIRISPVHKSMVALRDDQEVEMLMSKDNFIMLFLSANSSFTQLIPTLVAYSTAISCCILLALSAGTFQVHPHSERTINYCCLAKFIRAPYPYSLNASGLSRKT